MKPGSCSNRHGATSAKYGSVFLFFLAFCAILCAAGSLWGDSWKEITPGGTTPGARYGHSMVVMDGKVCLFGGSGSDTSSSRDELDSASLLNDLWTFVEGSNEWQQVTPDNSGPVPRRNHGAGAFGEKLFIFFGEGAGGVLGDTWIYDLSSNSWSEVNASGGPSARKGHAVVVANGFIYVVGGTNAYNTALSDLWEFDPNTLKWTAGTPTDVGITGHSAVATDTTLYVYGGDNGQLVHSHLLSFDYAANAWTTITPVGDTPTGRTLHTATLDANKIRVNGGRSQTEELGDTWEYDIVSNQWVRKADGPVLSRSAAVVLPSDSSSESSCQDADADHDSAATVESNVLMFGGRREGTALDEMWEYFPADPTAPVVTGTSPTNDRTPTWKWTSRGGSGIGKYRYKLDNGNLSAGAKNTIGTSYTPTANLAAGKHTLYVQERDGGGNWSPSGKKTILVDVVPPKAPSVTGTSPTTDRTPTWKWTSGGGGNGRFRYKLDNGNLSKGAVQTTAGSHTPAGKLAKGNHTLYVQERDAAGNWSASGKKTILIR